MPSVSVIIPVYKRLNEFTQYLHHNIPYLQDCEIIIVNDDPQCHLPENLPYPDSPEQEIVWINNQKNLGFSCSVNAGAKKATGDYLFLLNSDVKLLDNSWRNVLSELTDNPDIFAISFAQKEKDRRIVGRNELYFKDGLFHHRTLSFDSARSTQHLALIPTGWAEGGSAIIRTSMWDTLGGFDEAYSPFYWEDVDLSYRAKLRGWQVLFAPSIVVEHHHESTIGAEYTKSKINATAFRNQMYFTGKFVRGLQIIEYLVFKYVRLPLQKMKKGSLMSSQRDND